MVFELKRNQGLDLCVHIDHPILISRGLFLGNIYWQLDEPKYHVENFHFLGVHRIWTQHSHCFPGFIQSPDV